MIPPTFVPLLLIYALFLNKQRVKGDCSLDSLSSDICSSDTCSIVKDLSPVTNVYRGQSVEVCAGATSGCDIGEEVKVNGSQITNGFTTTRTSSGCYVIDYTVDIADYNQTVLIKFRNGNGFISSNTTTINVKGPPHSPRVIVYVNCTHLTIDWIAYDTDYIQVNISCPQSQSMSYSNVTTNISLLLVNVINKNEDCRLYNVSVWPHNPAGWGMASTKQVSTITDPHGEIKRDSITFQFINTFYISIQYKLLFKCISSYPITVTANTHCPHHTGDVLRPKIIKWNIKNTKPLIVPKICGCDITTIKFSNYNNSVSKSLDTRGLVNVNVSVRLCEVTLECILNIGYYGDCKVVIISLTNNFNSSHIITQNGRNKNAISTVIHVDPGRYKIHGYDWIDSTKVLPKCPPVRTSINVITCEPTPATRTSTNVTPTSGGAEHPNSGAIIGGAVSGLVILVIVVVIIIGIILCCFNRHGKLRAQQPAQPPVQQPVQPPAQQPVQSLVQQPVQPPVQQPVQTPVQQPVQPPAQLQSAVQQPQEQLTLTYQPPKLTEQTTGQPIEQQMEIITEQLTTYTKMPLQQASQSLYQPASSLSSIIAQVESEQEIFIKHPIQESTVTFSKPIDESSTSTTTTTTTHGENVYLLKKKKIRKSRYRDQMITLTPGYHKPTEGKLIISGRKKHEFEETYITTGIENVGREESEILVGTEQEDTRL